MIILGIESATDLVGAALDVDGATRAEVSEAGGRRHAEALAPAIADVLSAGGVALSDLDAIAVDLGPGLFTGLRVGLATAKGLSQALGTGLLGCTSLEALACGALDEGWSGTVLAVVDARRGEVFVGRYGRDATNGTVELVAPARHRPEELSSLATGLSGVLALGDGALRYRDLLEGIDGVTMGESTRAHPSPATLASLAARRIAAGARLVGPAELGAMYLRDADARINWVRRDPVGASGA